MPFTAQAESGSVSPADGSLFDKNGTTVCNSFCRTMRQLPTRMLWQESELAEMALTGQDNCRAFMNVRQGEQCRRMTALRKCGGATAAASVRGNFAGIRRNHDDKR